MGLAVKGNKIEYVQLLLSHKADVDVGFTRPVLIACQQKTERIEILKLLLKHKCNVFLATGNNSDTLIHRAAAMGHYKSIEIIYNHLIESKCDKNKIDNFFNQQESKKGNTAYIVAVEKRQFEVIDVLLRICKVDGDIKDNRGFKARDILPLNHDKRKWMIQLEQNNKNTTAP